MGQFGRVAETLEQDELLVSALGHDGFFDQLDNRWKVIMDRRKFKFVRLN